MRHLSIITSLVVIVALSACATRDGARRSTVHESIYIENGSAARIKEAAQEVMASFGYQQIDSGNSQEPNFRQAHPNPVLRWIREGNQAVTLILVPAASGWSVVLSPDPDGLNPGPSAHSLRPALQLIRTKATQTPAAVRQNG